MASSFKKAEARAQSMNRAGQNAVFGAKTLGRAAAAGASAFSKWQPTQADPVSFGFKDGADAFNKSVDNDVVVPAFKALSQKIAQRDNKALPNSTVKRSATKPSRQLRRD